MPLALGTQPARSLRGVVQVPGDKSISHRALLFGAIAEGTTRITGLLPAEDPLSTAACLRAFGAQLSVGGPGMTEVTVTPGASLRGQDVIVPGDISSAAFWLVAGAITPGADLTVQNVGLNPSRTGVLDVLEQMGARIELLNGREVAGEPVGDLRVTHGPLQAFTIGAELIPRLVDEIPVLAVAACYAEGISRVTGAEELRVKETDRLAVMARQLGAMGARIEEFADGLTVQGGLALHGAEVDSETDHRVAMSLAVAAQVANGPTQLHRPEAAAVSYPGFWEDLERLQA